MPPKKENAAKTISIVMVITLLGKVLGLVRDRLLAVNYGSGLTAAAFLTASRLPRVFFDVLFASAIASCFIPVFSESLVKKGKEESFGLARSFLTLIIILTAALTVLGMAFAKPLSALMMGAAASSQALELTASLTRLMFPTALITGIAFSLVGILQSMNRFYVPAFLSAVPNLVIIAYFIFMNETYGVYGLVAAFLIGWLLQVVVQLPSLRQVGFRYKPKFNFLSEDMKKILILMLPILVASWVQPINSTINTRFGWALYNGAGVTAIEMASSLYLVIAGVFVLSVTNVIFPKLSRLTAESDDGEFTAVLQSTLQGSFYFVLPMTAGLMIVAHPLIDFIYGGGAFDAFSVSITAQALFWLALGMIGYAMQNILSRAYFAKQDGKTPLVAAIISIATNLVLCMLLTPRFEISGLALASALSSVLYGLLLLIPLQMRGEKLFTQKTVSSFSRMLLATVIMAFAAYFALQLTAGLLSGKLGLLLCMGFTAVVGSAAYFITTKLLGLEEAVTALQTAKRMLKRG